MEINKEINKVSPDNKNKKTFHTIKGEIYFTITNIVEVLLGTINIQSIFNFYM